MAILGELLSDWIIMIMVFYQHFILFLNQLTLILNF